ncbi:OmpA family protein [Acidocella sp.]|uniref:OmpA family protein n=1 Tax=Acidocella sp. TaxID=50710 RepID=UPI0026292493|nr:OmpA family protein [Acidocella sp.]
MNIRNAFFAATCLALPLAAPLAAQAQPVTGPYVSFGVGASIANPFTYNYEAYNNSQTGKFQSRPAYAGAGAIGYGFGNGFRVELGGIFDRNTIHEDDNNVIYNPGLTVSGPGITHYKASGGMNTYGPMLNGYYDMNIGLPVFPYIGAGVGYQWTKFSRHINDIASFGDTVEGTQGSFAYDVIAGLSFPLPSVPGLSLTAEYRFTQLVQSRNYASTFQGASDGPVHLGQMSSHTFLIGMRYQIFNPPPAAPVAPVPATAPMAAPAPAPARTFLVFFDWDKADLTPRATQIISEAASDSKTANVTTLQVSGYTDTSGTADYNMGLSERRAKAVAGQLESDGVPASEIEIQAYGETHLLVPTGPGVREPQNRRVEIVLQ